MRAAGRAAAPACLLPLPGTQPKQKASGRRPVNRCRVQPKVAVELETVSASAFPRSSSELWSSMRRTSAEALTGLA